MSAGPLTYVVSNSTAIIGVSVKQPIDVVEVTLDFDMWLTTSETLTLLQDFAIAVAAAPAWQVDFPFPVPAPATPADTNPLTLSGAAIGAGGTSVSLTIGAGTTGLQYTASFVATTASGRQKEIDLRVIVAAADNPMITSAAPPVQNTTVVGGTTALPAGTGGTVYVGNVAAAQITLTLPPSPVLGQQLVICDSLGNAAQYHTLIQGAAGALIAGLATFSLNQNYMSVTVQWNGSSWSML